MKIMYTPDHVPGMERCGLVIVMSPVHGVHSVAMVTLCRERGPYRDTEGFIETSIERENYVMLSMQSLSCG